MSLEPLAVLKSKKVHNHSFPHKLVMRQMKKAQRLIEKKLPKAKTGKILAIKNIMVVLHSNTKSKTNTHAMQI